MCQPRTSALSARAHVLFDERLDDDVRGRRHRAFETAEKNTFERKGFDGVFRAYIKKTRIVL